MKSVTVTFEEETVENGHDYYLFDTMAEASACLDAINETFVPRMRQVHGGQLTDNWANSAMETRRGKWAIVAMPPVRLQQMGVTQDEIYRFMTHYAGTVTTLTAEDFNRHDGFMPETARGITCSNMAMDDFAFYDENDDPIYRRVDSTDVGKTLRNIVDELGMTITTMGEYGQYIITMANPVATYEITGNCLILETDILHEIQYVMENGSHITESLYFMNQTGETGIMQSYSR